MPGSAHKSDFPFSFFRRRVEEETGGLAPLMIAAQRASQAVLSGQRPQRKAGHGDKFWRFREYDPSDRPQDIDWRVSGKGDRIYVREKEKQTAQTTLFWCAGELGMDFRSDSSFPTKREAAISLCLSLAHLMTRAGEQIGALDSDAQTGRSEIALQGTGRALLGASAALPPVAGLKLPRNAGLVLAGDFLDPPETLAPVFETLAAQAGSALVIQTLDPAELSFPYNGRIVFEGFAHKDRYPVESAAAVRDSYRSRIESHLDAVRALCRRNQWTWILHPTDRNIRTTLLDIWAMTAPHHLQAGGAA